MRRFRTPDWQFIGWSHKLFYDSVHWWHNPLLIRAHGLENVPHEGGAVLAVNHTSWWDPIAVSACSGRPVNWLAKKELFSNPLMDHLFSRAGAIPVDRQAGGGAAYAAAVDALRQRRLVGIAPEGTRHVGTLGPAKTGVARLALAADAPVVPFACLTDRFWPPGQALPDLKEKVWVNIGQPMRLEGNAESPEDARRETDRVMDAIAALLEEARAARERGEKWIAP